MTGVMYAHKISDSHTECMYLPDNKMLTLNVCLQISEATIHEIEAYPRWMYS